MYDDIKPIAEIIFCGPQYDSECHEMDSDYVYIKMPRSNEFKNDHEMRSYMNNYQMIWGEKECVLNIPVDPKISEMKHYQCPIDQLSREDIQKVKDIFHKINSNEKDLKIDVNDITTYPVYYYKIPLLKIISVIPSSIYGYYSNVKMSQCDVIKFIKDNIDNDKNGGDIENMLKRYPNIKLLEDDGEDTYKDCDEPFNISININSYYLEHENPSFTVHDGSYILLQLENGNIMTVWDD